MNGHWRVRGYSRVGWWTWRLHSRWPNPLTWLAYWAWHRWILRYFWYGIDDEVEG